MNNNFKCIYKILSTLEAAMDYSDFDVSQIDHNRLEISKERWNRYIEMLSDSGYVKGVRNIFRVMSVLIVQISALLSRDWNI